ncbi:craniofacial development protein 1-like [Penaeus japonicus]|uniref:craniofacial development protein 1-like n=1 Tax=Penaeus japonicus TaxID=27405 RepID=UPI001C70CE85|nr:craniofacial development protein 1-like [Penaeus japonicus]
MLQDEDYDSDTSDEDFVPQGVESDDEPISGGEEDEEEDEGDEDGEGKSAAKDKKKKKKGKKKKGKKQNPLLAHVGEKEDETEEKDTEQDAVKEEKDKKKEDNLWADFLADVEDKPSPPPKPKASSWAALLGKKSSSNANSTSANPVATTVKKEEPKKDLKKESQDNKPSTVKITKVFEFAGEEVRIEKEVDANSAEAKAAILTPESSASVDKKSSAVAGVGGMKRPAGLSNIIGLLDNKKQKLTTLEKTKLDWNNFKAEEGIDEELESHKKSKHGYLDKQAFLERADVRQFEIERAMRQSKRSNR